MLKNDIFAMRDSSYNAFLFADVGIERDGSPLTMLSMLARHGEDPWAQAARWAAQPRAVAIEALAAHLNDTPSLAPLMEIARPIASRLILLLPGQSSDGAAEALPRLLSSAMQRGGLQRWGWMILALFCLSMILASFMSARPTPAVGPSSRTGTVVVH